MRFTEFTERVVESIINEAQPAIRIEGPAAANDNRPPSPEQLRRQLRAIEGGLSAADRQAVRQVLQDRSLWNRLAAWGARTAGRHAGATIASGVTGPAAPAVAAIANLALLGYDVVSLGTEIWDWAQGSDVELPRADADAFTGDIPIEAPPRPNNDNSTQRGRNLRGSQLAWDRLYGNTHQRDGSPIVNFDPDPDVPVFQPDAAPEAPVVEPVAPEAPTAPEETPSDAPDAPGQDEPVTIPVVPPVLPDAPEPEDAPTIDPSTPEPAPQPEVDPAAPEQPEAPEETPSDSPEPEIDEPVRRDAPVELPQPEIDTPPQQEPEEEPAPQPEPAPAPQPAPLTTPQTLPQPQPQDEPETRPQPDEGPQPSRDAPARPAAPDLSAPPSVSDVVAPPVRAPRPASSSVPRSGGTGGRGRTRARRDFDWDLDGMVGPAEFVPIQIADPLQLKRYQQFK